MRAFAGGFYANLLRMYDYLGIQYKQQPFMFSFSRLLPRRKPGFCQEEEEPYMTHASNFHQIPPVPGRDIVQWMVEVCYVLIFYTWFTLCCFFVPPSDKGEDDGEGESLEEYLHRIHLPRYYVASYLLPMISSVCTCSHSDMLRFPASDVLEYKRCTHRQPHYVVTGGVHSVQEKLLQGLDVRLGMDITRVEPRPDTVEIRYRDGNGREDSEQVDLVVLAVSPDIVARVFEPLRECLVTDVPTTTVETVAHTDYSTLSPQNACAKPVRSTSTSTGPKETQRIHFRSNNHITEAIHEQQNSLLVTTNPLTPLDPAKAIQSAVFTRVLRSPRSQALVNGIFSQPAQDNETAKGKGKWCNGDDGVYLAGGWCWDGMVLLEGCVVSAMRVAEGLGVEVPW